MSNATTTSYRVEMAAFTPAGVAPRWMSATPHVYKRRNAAQKLANSLSTDGYRCRVVAS